MENNVDKTNHIEFSLASPGERIAAFLIDLFSLIAPGLVVAAIVWPIFGEAVAEKAVKTVGGVLMVLVIVLQIFLFVRRSQTIGKFLMDIQIINTKTNKRIGYWRNAFLRELIGRTLIIGVIPFLNITFQPLYFIIDHFFIFRKDRRTLHDMIAGTCVIKLSNEHCRKSLVDWKRLPK